MHRPDALGEDRRRSGRTGRQAFGKRLVVEQHAHDKRLAWIATGVTAAPVACTCPVEIACSTLSTLPVWIAPGMNLKVISTGWPDRA